ncbi:uncharacterized protein SOCE836_066330 [Sorangium cellulosum]|uniref:Uncharacterized protein n=1 Tax=Sorangium cellulosum TaxID=56 RepID=A0A4P2QVK7_SORCE|nr:uncharacterized protein SOCE836_066330 [Sorangium cellulosum]
MTARPRAAADRVSQRRPPQVARRVDPAEIRRDRRDWPARRLWHGPCEDCEPTGDQAVNPVSFT